MDVKRIFSELDTIIPDPTQGLPEAVFKYVTRITPMINVDLLIKDEEGHTLLTWRDDGFYEPGWHVPGGIIRYKEKISDRIRKVASDELGTTVRYTEGPIAINEVIHAPRRTRGHFISLLFACTLISALDAQLKYEKGTPKAGEWAWYKGCPGNILSVHEMYRKYM